MKRTFVLSRETDARLSVLARLRGVDRSRLVEGVLAEACRGVVILFADGVGGGTGCEDREGFANSG